MVRKKERKKGSFAPRFFDPSELPVRRLHDYCNPLGFMRIPEISQHTLLELRFRKYSKCEEIPWIEERGCAGKKPNILPF